MSGAASSPGPENTRQFEYLPFASVTSLYVREYPQVGTVRLDTRAPGCRSDVEQHLAEVAAAEDF